MTNQMHGPDSGEPLFPGSVRDRCKPTSWCGNGNHLGMVSDVQRRTMQPFVSWWFLWTFTSRITSNITLPQSVRPRQITPPESGSSPDAGVVLGREALLLPIEGKRRYKGIHACSARSPLFISADRSESVKAVKTNYGTRFNYYVPHSFTFFPTRSTQNITSPHPLPRGCTAHAPAAVL